MAVETTVNIYGLRDSLAVLRQLDPEQRKAAVRKMKAAGSELTAIGKENYPTFVPLRGWSTGGRLGYSPAAVRRGVQVQVGGRQPRKADSYAVITLVQKNAGGALFDIAGLRGGTVPGRRGPNPSFIAALDGRYGKSQRGMWRSIRRIADTGYTALLAAANEVAASANRKLVN